MRWFWGITVFFALYSPLPAQQNRAQKTEPGATTRRHRYIIDGGPGFVLGLNNSYFENKAKKYHRVLTPYFKSGSSLGYGFALAFNLGVVWFLKPRKVLVIPENPPEWDRKWPQGWALGFQLRNTLGFAALDFAHIKENSGSDTSYHQTEERSFYNLQAVINLRYVFSPVWELQLYLGPSLNVHFYRKYNENLHLLGDKRLDRTEVKRAAAWYLGAVIGAAIAYRISPLLAVGFSNQFTISMGPPQSLGHFAFTLYLQAHL